MSPTTVRYLKGHGTENDFVLLPDADGSAGPPDPALVRQLCDRDQGVGADGVIRVVRTDATDDPAAVEQRARARWFMDYRNADGSLSEMCGNGVRVLGRYLAVHEGEDVTRPLPVATRDGVKILTFEGGVPHADITVDMGTAHVIGRTEVSVDGRSWPAVNVDVGNPHAVVFVDDLDDAGPLTVPPEVDPAAYPDGVNVEFVVRRGPGHLAVRVHERGSGETRSCGTGACAVTVAAAAADQEAAGESAGAGGSAGEGAGAGPGAAYEVDLPGGRLVVRRETGGRLLLTGPAVLVEEGNWVAGR